MKRKSIYYALSAITIVIIVVVAAWLAKHKQTSKASLTSNPTSLSEHRVQVPITIDTAGATINAAQIELTFDTSKVQVTSISKDPSIFSLWISGEPSYSNSKGTVDFSGGIPRPGFKGKGQIGSVTLSAKAATSTQLKFTSTTTALLNDGLGTPIPLNTDPISVNIP